MSTPTLSVIVHGHHWPAPDWMQALRAALSVPAGSGPASVVEILEAHEDAVGAGGAARAIDRTIRRATGDLLLVIEAGAAWTTPALIDLVSAVHHADVVALVLLPADQRGPASTAAARIMEVWNPATPGSTITSSTGVIADVESACTVALDDLADRVHAGRVRLFAVRRSTLQALGGLDVDFWSVGFVEHLAAKALSQGIDLHVLHATIPDTAAHDAWPLRPHVRRFLTIRNGLLAAILTRGDAAAGRAVAVLSALALADAWRHAAIPAAALRFGGAWGERAGVVSRMAGRSTRDSAGVWPRDEPGTLLPLLALDSFLDVLVNRRLQAPGSGLQETPGPGVDEPLTQPPAASQRPDEASGSRLPAPEALWLEAPSVQPPVTGGRPPFVSVIVVNWNGREHLDACFSSLLASEYPADRVEFICVDNGSTDDSRELLASRFARVRVVVLDENRGFTGGNAAGVKHARGDVLAFFNNDMRVAPATLRDLVGALDDEHPCAAAEVRSWDGRRIDFVRGSVNFETQGFQDHYGEPWRPELAASADTFFPNGGAFAITRNAYERAGGFDEDFFAYYDDVDLGFGVRLNGGRIRVVHSALVYHRHGSTSRRYPSGQKRYLMERNALWTAIKRYADGTLDRSLGALLLLRARRIAQGLVLRRKSPWALALSTFSQRCRRRNTAPALLPSSAIYETGPLPAADDVLIRLPVESLAAVGEALAGLPVITAKRREIQARRTMPDRLVVREFGRALEYASPLASYQAVQDALVDRLGLASVFRGRTRVLIITHEPLRRQMSGPGVRALELGRALGATMRVTVATPVDPEIADDRCTVAPYDPHRPATLRRLAEDADVLVVQGFTLTQYPFLTGLHVPIVADLYCPFTVEYLEMKTADARAAGAAAPAIDVQMEAISILEVQNAQLRHGDFFICASERQRDFWLGTLHTAGRINASVYAADPTLRGLIDVVPFGVPQEPFEEAAARAHELAGGPVLKGARTGIGVNDRVLLWGGSLLDWQDPLTLIRAVATLAACNRHVRLFFMGTRHPNPHVAPMRIVRASMDLARELGVLDTHVFFNDWVAYDQRAAYLAEADLGLSTHRLHLETHFSFRTRMLDYLWSALPIVCSEGDYFADLVNRRGLGIVVPPGDAEALAGAIARLLDDVELRESCGAALRVVRDEMRWTHVAQPLARFCAAPRFAADHEPAMRAVKAKLKQGYRVSKWLKRTMIGVGISEGRVEQVKQLGLVQAAMRVRNRVALARAGRPRG